MFTFQPPQRDQRFVLFDLLDAPGVLGALPAFAEVDAALIGQVVDEAGRFAAEVLFPLNAAGDAEGCRWDDGEVRTPRRLSGRLSRVRRGRLAGAVLRARTRWPGPAADARLPALRDAGGRQSRLDDVSRAAARRLRMPGGARQRRAQAALSAQGGQRRMARHDGADRGPRRLGPRTAAHPRRAAGRRQLRDHRQQDLHLRCRTRPDPTTSCTWCWRASPVRPRAAAGCRCSSCPSGWATTVPVRAMRCG